MATITQPNTQGGALLPTNNGGQASAPLLAPGTSAFKPQAPITFGTVPGLTANFTGIPKGTVKAPAVVTADDANEHIDNMTNAAQTTNADIQNAAAAKANIAATNAATAADATKNAPNAPASGDANATTPAGTGTDTTTPPNSYDQQINDIIASLGGGSGNPDTSTAQNEINKTDTDAIDTLNQENTIDSQNLQTVNDALTQLENGTMPLTPGEQAQVDNIKNSFAGAIKDAMAYAQNVQGGMAAKDAGGEGGGLAEYSPQMAMADMASAVQMGADKINKVNSDILSAQAQLTKSLQDGDYKTASRLYTQISSGITARNNEIDKINTSIQNQIDKMQTNALDVAKTQITALTGEATRDATSAYRAQQLILSTSRLSETERHDAITELNSANGTRTTAERSAQAVSQFGAAFVPGATMADGTPTVDDNGYITPAAWKAAIADAPTEGLNRADFIKAFGSMVYSDSKKGIDGRAYGLTPAEIKIINGALPATG